MSDAMRGLVIMPTYNERDNLPRIVPLVLAQDSRLEMLVIDDASPDGRGNDRHKDKRRFAVQRGRIGLRSTPTLRDLL
jgi:glycosyltransferase involved in cell wall biosynthesis